MSYPSSLNCKITTQYFAWLFDIPEIALASQMADHLSKSWAIHDFYTGIASGRYPRDFNPAPVFTPAAASSCFGKYANKKIKDPNSARELMKLKNWGLTLKMSR